jgi:hypothetical protein
VFQDGYLNQRTNVTLLYGLACGIGRQADLIL